MRPLLCCASKIVVDSGLVIKPFEESRGDKLYEIFVAFSILAQQHKVIVPALPRLGRRTRVPVGRIAMRVFAAVMPAALGHIHFAADDRLHAARLRRLVKRLRSKQVAVIGDRNGRHLAPRRLIHDLFEVASSIQQAIVCVQMQVNESGIFHAERYSNLARQFLLRRKKAFPLRWNEFNSILHRVKESKSPFPSRKLRDGKGATKTKRSLLLYVEAVRFLGGQLFCVCKADSSALLDFC